MGSARIKVLYVDDEPDLLEICRFYLEKDDAFDVDLEGAACNVMDLLARNHYDAVISDYQMPGLSGIDLLKMVRASGNDVPFVLFTGRGREEVVIEAINSGADFYVQKGGDIKSQFRELEHKLTEAVRRRRAERALRENEQRLTKAQSIGRTGSWEQVMRGGSIACGARRRPSTSSA